MDDNLIWFRSAVCKGKTRRQDINVLWNMSVLWLLSWLHLTKHITVDTLWSTQDVLNNQVANCATERNWNVGRIKIDLPDSGYHLEEEALPLTNILRNLLNLSSTMKMEVADSCNMVTTTYKTVVGVITWKMATMVITAVKMKFCTVVSLHHWQVPTSEPTVITFISKLKHNCFSITLRFLSN